MQQLRSAVQNLHPAYFALVMATGIVSLASFWLGFPEIAWVLFILNVLFFAVLVALSTWRIVAYRQRFLADLTDHNRGVGFFTIIAAMCVLGSQFVLLAHDLRTGGILWCFGVVLWLAITYIIFTSFTVKKNKPSLAKGINGGWLLAVVTTQAVSNLGGLLAQYAGVLQENILFFTLAMWLFGGMLYIWMISLIFYRYTFFEFEPSDLAPPYWINMGAVAISTLAGTRLIANAPDSALLSELLPFLKGFSLLFWSTATWWIPMLVILAVWRHVFRGYPIAYDPLYWGLVFPLGMYTACTFQLANATGIIILFEIAQVFIYVAIFAWCATFIGLLMSLWRHWLARPAETVSDRADATGAHG